jgi:hypothetical protein
MSAGLAAGARTILRCNQAVLDQELDRERDQERDQDMSPR